MEDFLYVSTIVDAPKVSDPSLPQLQKVFAPVVIKTSDVIEERPISRKELFTKYFGYTDFDWEIAVSRSKMFGNEMKDDEVKFIRFNYNNEEKIGWVENR